MACHKSRHLPRREAVLSRRTLVRQLPPGRTALQVPTSLGSAQGVPPCVRCSTLLALFRGGFGSWFGCRVGGGSWNRRGVREHLQNRRPVGAAPAGARIPSRPRLVAAIISGGDVVKRSGCAGDLLVKRGIDIPCGSLNPELKQAIKPAHSGATALVPPTTILLPSTLTWYPELGSASPATSGIPRPRKFPALTEGGTLRAGLPGGKREGRADSAPRRPVAREVVPHLLAGDGGAARRPGASPRRPGRRDWRRESQHAEDHR